MLIVGFCDISDAFMTANIERVCLNYCLCKTMPTPLFKNSYLVTYYPLKGSIIRLQLIFPDRTYGLNPLS